MGGGGGVVVSLYLISPSEAAVSDPVYSGVAYRPWGMA